MKSFAQVILFVYCVFSLLTLSFGYSDQTSSSSRACEYKTRGSKLFPAYRLGCYLGERIE